MSIRHYVLMAVLLGVVVPDFAAGLAEEISWVRKMPGITLVSSIPEGDTVTESYMVGGKPAEVYAAIKAEALKQGWAVEDEQSNEGFLHLSLKRNDVLKLVFTLSKSGEPGVLVVALQKT